MSLIRTWAKHNQRRLTDIRHSDFQRKICENEEKGLMVNTESYCSPLSALLRIAIRFTSQHPRTRASRTEYPFAAHARGRMRSAATPLDCSQVGAGMPLRAILLAQLKDWFLWDKELLLLTFVDTLPQTQSILVQYPFPNPNSFR
ncbi:hypothetical protein C8J56DRAFT_1034903 [Mycena floridula]|nr:hypothetical protein C8J56DRAFT_1034903 [Mycena floridula]